MLDQVLRSLIDSQNEAADDVLLECLRLGTLQERLVVLRALLKRESVKGLTGVIEIYDELAQAASAQVITNIGVFHHALRECGRSDRIELRLAAMKLIAVGHQGKLAYVLSENLYEADDSLVHGAVEGGTVAAFGPMDFDGDAQAPDGELGRQPSADGSLSRTDGAAAGIGSRDRAGAGRASGEIYQRIGSRIPAAVRLAGEQDAGGAQHRALMAAKR